MALRNQPYLPLYVNDFMSDEKLRECSAESTGVYIRIMCLMHKSRTYGKILLKQNDKQNASNIQNFACKLLKHLPYQRDVVERALEELVDYDVLQLSDSELVQKRMVKDNELSETRSKAGRKGGRKTQFDKAKNKAGALKFAKAKTQANYESESEYENEDNIDLNKDLIDLDKAFDTFWAAYPKKKAKQDAIKAWGRHVRPSDVETIMRSLAANKQTREWTKDGGQFIPFPATWLNGERWKDEDAQPQRRYVAGEDDIT